jgi:hypothetical protein
VSVRVFQIFTLFVCLCEIMLQARQLCCRCCLTGTAFSFPVAYFLNIRHRIILHAFISFISDNFSPECLSSIKFNSLFTFIIVISQAQKTTDNFLHFLWWKCLIRTEQSRFKVRFPEGILSFQSPLLCPDRLWSPSCFLTIEYRGLFLRL